MLYLLMWGLAIMATMEELIVKLTCLCYLYLVIVGAGLTMSRCLFGGVFWE
jgi:hypothetical protein